MEKTKEHTCDFDAGDDYCNVCINIGREEAKKEFLKIIEKGVDKSFASIDLIKDLDESTRGNVEQVIVDLRNWFEKELKSKLEGKIK